MAKHIAILAVNPVNGYGLFQYLEAFYEHSISYKVFSVAEETQIRTNSGIRIETDDVVANLKGHAEEYDGLVFACGDAIPVFKKHTSEPYYTDMFQVMREFAEKHKLMIGHCAAALLFEKAGITNNVKLSVHPMAKPAISKGIATDNLATIDNNFYTAQDEHSISAFLPQLLDVLNA
jgi:protease I